MIEHRAADVGDDALAGAHHQVKAQPGCHGKRDSDGDGAGERLVKKPRIAAAEAGVDDVLHALPEGKPATRGDQQRGERRGEARPVGK